jgi:hypothetical protein
VVAHIRLEEGETAAKYLNMAMKVRSLLLIKLAVSGYDQGGRENLGRRSGPIQEPSLKKCMVVEISNYNLSLFSMVFLSGRLTRVAGLPMKHVSYRVFTSVPTCVSEQLPT